MKIINYKIINKKFFEELEFKEIPIVKKILNDVRKYGDKAIKKYTGKYDKVKLKKLEISNKEIQEVYKQVDRESIQAIKKAAENIEFFTKKQMSCFKNFETEKNGVVLGQKIIPIERVGCYVPGGRYPLPSSALMSIIPAKVAGVKEITVCSPKIKPITIVAADIAGADRIFNIGGVQAIGAMAYGTESVPKVDKIVGPGNKYVTAAKKEVYGVVGIDFIAGPSEALIIADETADVEFIAADLLAQAEHDPNSKIGLITNSRKLAEKVNTQLKVQLSNLKTKNIAKLSLENGMIIIVKNLEESIKIANKKAPEHLEFQVKNPKWLIKKLRNYGSLFIGNYSAEVFGDYCSGTNHILPTNGAAKYTGGLSVKDFVKIVTYQKIEKKAIKNLVKITSKLAGLEGLDAHKKSAEIRISKLFKQKLSKL